MLSRSASGQPLASHVTLLDGPMPAGAADGPRELHLILLDNGRSDLLRWGYGEALACIRCGACQNVCPVYREIGGHAYGGPDSGPVGSIFMPLLPAPPSQAAPVRWRTLLRSWRVLPTPAAEPVSPPAPAPSLRGSPFADLPRASTLCGACADVCPVGIDIPRLLVRLRGDLVEAGESGTRKRLLRRAYGWGMQDVARYRRIHRMLRRRNPLAGWPEPAPQTFRQRWQGRSVP
jgi:L-lactate dehydrogenase complex protein LldF